MGLLFLNRDKIPALAKRRPEKTGKRRDHIDYFICLVLLRQPDNRVQRII